MFLDRLSPILVASFGIAALSGMDAAIKFLSADYNAVTIATFRYFFGALVAGAIWVGAKRPVITLEMWRAHGLRGALALGAGLTFFYALGVLPLVDAMTLGFTAALIIPFAAWALLGERVRPQSMIAGAIGFIGAAIAAQGGASAAARHPDYALGVAAMAVSAVLYAICMAMLRQRAGRDGAPIVGLMQALVPFLLVVAPAAALFPAPRVADLPIFALMGLLGAGGWFFLIKAYARAEAQRLAPLEFTGLAWASLYGFALFNETPRVQTLIGAAIIIAACLFSEWSVRRAPVRAAAAVSPTD